MALFTRIRLLDLNSRALELLGARREEVSGLRLEELAPVIENEERYNISREFLMPCRMSMLRLISL